MLGQRRLVYNRRNLICNLHWRESWRRGRSFESNGNFNRQIGESILFHSHTFTGRTSIATPLF
jgi:hypothetical protein